MIRIDPKGLRGARRLGYHGLPCPKECPVCESSTDLINDDESCQCGWLDEYQAARRYAKGNGMPFTVSLEALGGHYYDGFDSGHVIEARDAWCFRSALRAARYFMGGDRGRHGRKHGASRNYETAVMFSYRSVES